MARLWLQILVGFKQGLIVLWDIEEGVVLQTYAATQVHVSMIQSDDGFVVYWLGR